MTSTETFEDKTRRNIRTQARYDELMREGKHGHYETMFRVVREEVELERERCAGIVKCARFGEIDGDLRSLIHRIENPSSDSAADGQ